MADRDPNLGKFEESCAILRLDRLGRALLRCRATDIPAVARKMGIDLPREACRAVRGYALNALWLGPEEWLLLNASPETGWAVTLDGQLDGVLHSLVDVSHRYAAFTVQGDRSEGILASGCSLDLALEHFPIDMCARTLFAKAEVVLWRKAADCFHLEFGRSYAGYGEAMLRQAERELDAIARIGVNQ